MHLAPAVTSLSMLTCTVPAFPAQPAAPVAVGDWERIPDGAAREAAARLAAHGYALLEGGTVPGAGAAAVLATALGLGRAFTPPQYRSRACVDGGGVTRITADAATAAHPALFQGTTVQVHGTSLTDDGGTRIECPDGPLWVTSTPVALAKPCLNCRP